jgi:hypothetical protein
MNFLAGLSGPVSLGDFHQLPEFRRVFFCCIVTIEETPVKELSPVELVIEIDYS